jgi:choline dehydrogenase-like flavoprotein
MQSVLLAASNQELPILANHRVSRILPGARKHILIVNGSSCSHKVYTRKITVSCGAIETPRLLHRSGLLKAKQFDFGFHAMSRLMATFDHEVNDLEDIDPHQAWTENYGSKFGVSVSNKGFLEATRSALGDNRPLDHKKALVFYASTAMDQNGTFIPLGPKVYPSYRFSRMEREKIHLSTKTLAQGLKNAGARDVIYNSRSPSLSTVHIFGSLPIGKSVVDRRGTLEGLGFPTIRVCDASLFPSAPLVNPQGPLMHLAKTLTRDWLGK